MNRADLPRYLVESFRSSESTHEGSDYDMRADTLKEAKERARYSVTEAFRVSGEMSTRFTYARVMDTKDGGVCVWDTEKPLTETEQRRAIA